MTLSAPVRLSGPDGANLYTENRRKLEARAMAQQTRLARRLFDRAALARWVGKNPGSTLQEVVASGEEQSRTLAALMALIELQLIEVNPSGEVYWRGGDSSLDPDDIDKTERQVAESA